jgi:hypothetical protein
MYFSLRAAWRGDPVLSVWQDAHLDGNRLHILKTELSQGSLFGLETGKLAARTHNAM